MVDGESGSDEAVDPPAVAGHLTDRVDPRRGGLAVVVDDHTTAMKMALIELINKRAKAFDEAVNDRMIAALASADLEAFVSIFKEFSEWEANAAQEFERLER